MRIISLGVFFAILTGCSDSDHYNRGYVISQSEFEEPLLDESNNVIHPIIK